LVEPVMRTLKGGTIGSLSLSLEEAEAEAEDWAMSLVPVAHLVRPRGFWREATVREAWKLRRDELFSKGGWVWVLEEKIVERDEEQHKLREHAIAIACLLTPKAKA
ncbi:hypothetical protein PanWU01x14_106400, partial [Parasponia andersonii]